MTEVIILDKMHCMKFALFTPLSDIREQKLFFSSIFLAQAFELFPILAEYTGQSYDSFLAILLDQVYKGESVEGPTMVRILDQHQAIHHSEIELAEYISAALKNLFLVPTIILDCLLESESNAVDREVTLKALVHKRRTESATKATEAALQDPEVLSEPQHMQKMQSYIDQKLQQSIKLALQQTKLEQKNSKDGPDGAQQDHLTPIGLTTDGDTSSLKEPSKHTLKRREQKRRQKVRQKQAADPPIEQQTGPQQQTEAAHSRAVTFAAQVQPASTDAAIVTTEQNKPRTAKRRKSQKKRKTSKD